MEKIQVSGGILRDLRTRSGYSVDEVASKIGTTPERLQQIESGSSSTTIPLIEKLADIYHRPLAAFFVEQLPNEPHVADFRINRGKKLSPDVFLAERRARYLSEKVAEISGKRSEIPLFGKDIHAEMLASSFRKYLGEVRTKPRKVNGLLSDYKKVLEDKMEIVIIEFPIKSGDVRAFSLLDDISSIVLNERDAPPIKLFSLLHEACHLIRKTSAVCSVEFEQPNKPEEEQFCDNFAAEFLVPLDELKSKLKGEAPIEWDYVGKLAKSHGVSKQVAMLRLVKARRLTWHDYHAFMDSYYKKEQAKKPEFARRNWDKIFLNRVGNFALREVGNAYRTNRISSSEAIDALDLNTKYMNKVISK
jgi:Zn-dependent peptidase ImmA (M78 family)/DNA-binding XRE family transcriptional regulator